MTVINSSAPIILESAQTGYYVNKACVLEDHIFTTKDITDAQKIVWQYLYGKSRLNEDLSCQATRAQIAEGAGKKESSIHGMLNAMKSKGYLLIQAASTVSTNSINTYFLTLPSYALEKIKNAPKRGEKREAVESPSIQPYIENPAHVEGANPASLNKKLSTGEEQNFAYRSNVEQNGLFQTSGGGCSRPAGGLFQTSGGAVPDQPLILNINNKNNNNITKPPAVDNLEPSVQNKSDGANALLNKFNCFLDEITREHPNWSPLRRSTKALCNFNEEDRKQLHLLMTTPDILLESSVTAVAREAIKPNALPNPNESKPVEANTSMLEEGATAMPMQKHQPTSTPQPIQQSQSTLSPETKRAKPKPIGSSMDMIEIKLQEEKFLIEKSVQSTVISGITKAYNAGRIKGEAAKKSLSDLITEVLFYVCVGNKDKSQADKGNSAIYVCQAGTWGTPKTYHNHAIQKREMESKQAKVDEIKMSKPLFKKMGF